MCKSKMQGGQRCVGHATQRLAKAQQKKTEVEAAFAAGQASERQVAAARKANWTALVEYASTGAGSEALRAQWAQIGDPNDANARVLQGAIDDGAMLAQANRRAENEFRASQDKGPLNTPVPLTMAQRAQIEEHARLRIEQEAARAADPLGLRAAQGAVAVAERTEAASPASTQPVRVVRPAQVEQPVQAYARGQWEGVAAEGYAPEPLAGSGIPTQRPVTLSSGLAQAQNQAPVVPSAREQQAAEARQQREARAAEARQQREARAAEALGLKQARAESSRLGKEVAYEVKATKRWMTEVGTSKFTAPEHTWSGPGRWRGESRASWKDNRQAVATGRLRYGAAFEEARVRYAGEYTPSEILEACQRLESQGRDRISGRVRPEHPGWYNNYETIDESSISAAREAQFERAFSAQETNSLAMRYVGANLNGVLWRARGHRPKGSPRQEIVSAMMARLQRSWTQSRSQRAARRAE